MAAKNNEQGQGLSIAAMTLGIVSIISSLLWFFSIILGVLAIIFGAVAIKSPGRGKAIAGIVTGSVGILLSILVVVLVLMALPALQKSQRDTSRKSDISIIMSDITTFQSNNRGALPNANDLSTGRLGVILSIYPDGTPTTNQAIYRVGTSCNGASTQSTRAYSISVLLENDSTYCLDS